MERAAVGGVELEFEVLGAGEPVVLVHAGVCADWFAPLLDEPSLVEHHRVLSYHRAGYSGSSRVEGPLSIADNAEHCRLLMQHAGIERAHLVGHSSSAMIALQLALDAPESVHTLALLESARPAPQSETQAEFVQTVAGPAVERYRAGDKAGAVDTWMEGVCGPGYRDLLERALPEGAFDQAVADSDTFFGQELPAVQQWSFGPEEAGRIAPPALVVLGENSRETFRERRNLLLAWLPSVEAFDLPGATHLLHVENPRGLAEGLTAFFGRHPLPA
jgi:pimeloyl-ACP methyl ester carboxylesterase